MFDEGQQELVEFLRTDLGSKPVESRRHHFGIELLAVLRQDEMADLVDQAHGEKRAGMDGTLGVLCRVAHLVHAVRKVAACRQIGEDDVAVKGKKRLGELVACSCALAKCEIPSFKPCAPDFRCQVQSLGRTAWKCHRAIA